MEETKSQKILREIQEGVAVASEGMPETVKAYMALEQSAGSNHGVFDAKTRELIALALTVRTQCKYCIVLHCHNAINLGATKEEIYEAASLAIPFGGSKSFAYACTYLTDTIETFMGK